MAHPFLEKLKKRWGVSGTLQVILILIVFACTGFTVLYVEELILRLFRVPDDLSWKYRATLFIFITLPLYNIILLIYGFIFGQFRFFLNFEKKFFGRFLSLFKRKS